MASEPGYEWLANAPLEIRRAATIAQVCAGISRAIGILATTAIIALLPTWVPGILSLQPLPVALLALSIGSSMLAGMGSRNRERIVEQQFAKARSSSLLATILGFVLGVIPGVLFLFLFIRIGRIMEKSRPDDPKLVYLIPHPSRGLFLGRYFGWIAAYFLVLYVGYTQLPQGLAGISDWLSPALGVHFNTLMVATYLLLTNPLTYPPLFALWASAGLLGGLIAGGRVRRGFYVGLTVFLSTLGAMGLAALSIARGFSFASLVSIPPPPPGFSLTGLATGPVAKDLIPLFVQANSPTDRTFLMNMALTLVRNAGLVFATVTISGRAGCLLSQGGLLLAKQATKHSKKNPSQVGDGGKSNGGKIVKTGIFLLMLAVLSLLPYGNPVASALQASPVGPYQQNLDISLNMLGAPSVNLTLTHLDLTSRGLVVDSNYDNANFSMFLVNNDYSQALGNIPGSLLLRLFSQPSLITYFTTDRAASAPKADAIAGQFSKALNVSFTLALAVPTGQATMMIYSPSPMLTNSEAMKRALAILPTSSFSSLVNPVTVEDKKYALMLGLLPPLSGISIRALSFVMTAQFPRMFYKEGPHLLSLKTLLGFQNSIIGDTASNLSLISMSFQKGTTMYSSLGPNPFYDGSNSKYVLNATLTPRSDFLANFTFPFAPKITVLKSVSPTSGAVGARHMVATTVVNLDSVPVFGMNVTDTQSSNYYKPSLELSPSGTRVVSLSNFASGAVLTFNYSATPESSGKYVLSPVTVDFFWTPSNGTRIRYSINTDETVLTSSSGPITQFSTSFNDLWPYSILLVLFLVLAPITETLRLVSRRKKKQVQASPPDY